MNPLKDTPSQHSGAGFVILSPVLFLLLWSGGFTFAKFGLAYSEPMTFLALRYAIVVAAMAVLFLIFRPGLPTRRIDWLHLVVIGLLIQATYFGLSYMAFWFGVSSGVTALIVSLQPILVGVLAPYVVNENVNKWRWLGLLLGLVGAAIVITARSSIVEMSVGGVLCAFGALIGMTTATLYEKRFGVAHHPITANLIQCIVGFAAIIPLALLFEDMTIQWTTDFVLALAYLVIGNSLISVTLLLMMIRRGEASRVSALFFLIPPTASAIAWFILGETLSTYVWVGMAIAATGVAVVLKTKPAET